VAHRLVLLDGKRRVAAAAFAGAVSALSMPPYDAWPLLFVTFPALVLLLDGTGGGRGGLKAAAWTGFGFGFGYFLAGLWWIGAAFFVPGDHYQWMAPFAVIGLPLFLALFPAAGCALARALWSSGPARILALAFGLGLSEWLRGHVLTGFPWNEIGYALANAPLIGQTASVIGMEGLTPVAIAIFASPASLAGGSARKWRPVIAAGAALVLFAAFGAARLMLAGPAPLSEVKLRIMQPNLPQDDKFKPALKDQIMARYLALSDRRASPERSGMADVDILIWPESAFPFFLARTPDVLAQIGGLLPDGAVLLTGAGRLDDSVRPRRIYNSIHALGDDGAIIATYDKVHLVPGGEFLPFQDFLENSLGLRVVTRLPGGFTAGAEPSNITLPGNARARGVTFGPLICYEAIFPRGILADERPDALLNVTNDGWFGDTAGPHQHLAQARVRAIEQGLPLVRAANTGISAVIDPWGRILHFLPVGTEGTIDAELPLAAAPTIYHGYGIYLLLALYIATIVGVFTPPWRV
jgi:apolipoprotein N-acyltransferase